LVIVQRSGGASEELFEFVNGSINLSTTTKVRHANSGKSES
jgi:hypothetical protein